MDSEPAPDAPVSGAGTPAPAPAGGTTPGIGVVRAAALPPENEPVVDPSLAKAKTDAFKADASQAVLLRYLLAFGVFILLCREIAAVLGILDLQGRGVYHLSDWLIGLVITVVFLQTAYILQAIVVHYFSEGAEKLKIRPGLPGSDQEK